MKIPFSIKSFIGLLSIVLGGSLHAQFSIIQHTVDGGGGTSGGGSFSLQGTIGQPDASVSHSGRSFHLVGGFWNATKVMPPIESYSDWVEANAITRLNASFGDDFDGDGISNGLHYVFGADIDLIGDYPPMAPPVNVPTDVILILESSLTPQEGSWTELLRYEGGVLVFADANVTMADGAAYHANSDDRRFYRYRVESTL